MDRWTDKWIDGWMDEWIDGWMDDYTILPYSEEVHHLLVVHNPLVEVPPEDFVDE